MTPEIFDSSGLKKLTPTELSSLGQWIAAMRRSSAGGSRPGGCNGVIETRIDGEFKGWEGETVYKMQNGQIWQQASYHYHYHYAYSPEVIIYGQRVVTEFT